VKPKSGIYGTFLLNQEIVPVSHPDQSILEAALKAGVDLDHTCGGYGTCGTCLIEVEEGLEKFSERNEIEAEMAQDRGFGPHERLACQNSVHKDLVLTASRKKDSYKSK